MTIQMVDKFIIRVAQVETLRSLPGPAHLRVLSIHKGTQPQARLLSEHNQVAISLSLDSLIEFRGRVEISPGVDALVILKTTKQSGS